MFSPSKEGETIFLLVQYLYLKCQYPSLRCITAKSIRQYAIDHPNIRLKEVLPTDSTRVDANHEGPFGIKTKL